MKVQGPWQIPLGMPTKYKSTKAKHQFTIKLDEFVVLVAFFA